MLEKALFLFKLWVESHMWLRAARMVREQVFVRKVDDRVSLFCVKNVRELKLLSTETVDLIF